MPDEFNFAKECTESSIVLEFAKITKDRIARWIDGGRLKAEERNVWRCIEAAIVRTMIQMHSIHEA